MNLSANTKVALAQAPLVTGAATTGTKGAIVDMSGFNGCQFVGTIGTVGSTDDVTAFIQDSSSTGGTFAAIGGATVTSTTGDSDKFFIIDVYKPQKRYLRTVSNISGVVEYGGITATQYEPSNVATTHSAGTLAAAVVLSVSVTT